jgi:hypothetical protein
MSGVKIFRKTQRKGTAIHHPLLAFDIENDPETGKFINAAVYGYTRDHHGKEHLQNRYFTDQNQFTDYLMSLSTPKNKNTPTKIVLFNASYDFWFIEKITDDAKTLTSGTSIITGKLKNGIPIMDLTNLTRQGTLEDWIGYLHMEEKFGIRKESLDNLEARVKSDARATYELGNYLENFFVHEIGIPLKLTIASAARYLFSLKYFKDYWFRQEKDIWKSDYERKAYRGGRVECFVKGKEKIKSYDINSMYLSVMRDNVFPDPNTAKFFKDPKELPKNELYIADVTVTVPKQYIGVLPILSPETGKLIFPLGTFRGHFASPELNYAIKECGVKVIKIYSVITYKAKPYFREYAKFIWKKRKEYKDKGNKGMDILIKYLGNTLYGGFGQRNKENYMGKLNDFNLNDLITKNPPKISEIEGEKYITANGLEGEDSQHTFPSLPVFITSFARLVLLKALRANADNLIYTDTDSLKIRSGNIVVGITVGKELGEWDFEGEETIEFHKSKMYGSKCKGVPKRANLEWNDNVRKIYSYRKPNKMKESFRRGMTPAKWEKVIKEVSKIDDKRIWLTEKVSEPLFLDFRKAPF